MDHLLGVTMASSLLSLMLNKIVRKDLGMTGELTLTGNVLPIGGLKEKIIAAKRNNIKEIIAPSANKKDYEELSQNIKEGIKIHFVEHYQEVPAILFKK